MHVTIIHGMYMNQSSFGTQKDYELMEKALQQAEIAFAHDEVPVGAVVVNKQGGIIGHGYNQVISRSSQLAHAEMLALEDAGKNQKDWRLQECWLYVTLEPCAMCMNMIVLSRLAGVVFGAHSPLFGYMGGEQLDNNHEFPLYKKNALVTITGIQSEQSINLLKQFFKQKRNRGGSA